MQLKEIPQRVYKQICSLNSYIEDKIEEHFFSSGFKDLVNIMDDLGWKLREILIRETYLSSDLVLSYWSWVYLRMAGLEVPYSYVFKKEEGEPYYKYLISFYISLMERA